MVISVHDQCGLFTSSSGWQPPSQIDYWKIRYLLIYAVPAAWANRPADNVKSVEVYTQLIQPHNSAGSHMSCGVRTAATNEILAHFQYAGAQMAGDDSIVPTWSNSATPLPQDSAYAARVVLGHGFFTKVLSCQTFASPPGPDRTQSHVTAVSRTDVRVNLEKLFHG